MKRFATTITQANYDMKMQDAEGTGFFVEYKDESEHWKKRLTGLPTPTIGVFNIGKISHKHRVIGIVRHVPVDKIPGRYKTSMKTPHVWAIVCHVKLGDLE